jgi:hypothetical protein
MCGQCSSASSCNAANRLALPGCTGQAGYAVLAGVATLLTVAAAMGRATVPPTSVMNSRRLMDRPFSWRSLS